jgi:hypothetical protein
VTILNCRHTPRAAEVCPLAGTKALTSLLQIYAGQDKPRCDSPNSIHIYEYVGKNLPEEGPGMLFEGKEDLFPPKYSIKMVSHVKGLPPSILREASKGFFFEKWPFLAFRSHLGISLGRPANGENGGEKECTEVQEYGLFIGQHVRPGFRSL